MDIILHAQDENNTKTFKAIVSPFPPFTCEISPNNGIV